MKFTSQVLLLLLFLGCAAVKQDSQYQEFMIFDVIRTTEREDVRFQLPHDPAFYPTAKISFTVVSPEELNGMEIVLPIVEGLEGPMFQKEEFTLKIPKDYSNSLGFNFKYLLFEKDDQ